jgi:glycosyltransferase involved in cell wall biosynthesis
MKILMIAPQPFYSDRGTPMNVRLLARVLGEAGHSVDLLVFPTGQDIELSNVKIIRLPNILGVSTIPVGPSGVKAVFDILMVIAVLWMCLTKKYDVIHGIEEGGFIAVFYSMIFRSSSVLDLDSWMSDQLKDSGFIKSSMLLSAVSCLERWALNKSSMVLTVCEALTVKARNIASDAKIVQIEDVIPPEIKPYDFRIEDDIVNNYNLGKFRKVIYTGNLVKYQGIDLLLDSWVRFINNPEINETFKLVIVGGESGAIEHYKSIAGKKQLSETICWAGKRPLSEMGTWMKMGDILVSPRSDGENTPLKIFAYMSSGRPIVATRCKTHTQILDESSAFLAEPTPDKFSEAMIEAVRNKEDAVRKSHVAQQIVRENYSYASFSRKLLDAYDSIQQGA